MANVFTSWNQPAIQGQVLAHDGQAPLPWQVRRLGQRLRVVRLRRCIRTQLDAPALAAAGIDRGVVDLDVALRLDVLPRRVESFRSDQAEHVALFAVLAHQCGGQSESATACRSAVSLNTGAGRR